MQWKQGQVTMLPQLQRCQLKQSQRNLVSWLTLKETLSSWPWEVTQNLLMKVVSHKKSWEHWQGLWQRK